MQDSIPARVLVAHHRAPVQRLLRTNLHAEGFAVLGAASAAAALAALQTREIGALVLDAELVKGDRPECADLFRFLLRQRVPTLLLSWDPGDRLLARTLRDAPFLSRPDNVDQVLTSVHELVDRPQPAIR